ncbi:hypothetical protein [uncultured Polaribacter sp.]|uniref:hypothetical protein n=1 Tax=uncultured Polaribacter sp. TaxID=174711 RepID=UPI0026336547|nr:hypothetical protein [uncultured Polaribacter sp.]
MKEKDKIRIKEGTEGFIKIKNSVMSDFNRQQTYSGLVKGLKFWFIQFGKDHDLFHQSGFIDNEHFTTTLTQKGIDIIDTKNGFKKYYISNVIRKQKLEDYKYYSVKYWWLPILISIIAIIISLISFIKK